MDKTLYMNTDMKDNIFTNTDMRDILISAGWSVLRETNEKGITEYTMAKKDRIDDKIHIVFLDNDKFTTIERNLWVRVYYKDIKIMNVSDVSTDIFVTLESGTCVSF